MQRKERVKTRKSLLYRKTKHGRAGERSGLRPLPGIAAAGFVLLVLLSAASCLMKENLIPVNRAPLLGKLSFALATAVGCGTAARCSAKGKLLAAAAAGFALLAVTAVCFALRRDAEPIRIAAPLAITVGAGLLGLAMGARVRSRGYR